MPPWMIELLSQFPIVVVVGLVAWYAYSKLEAATIRAAAALDAAHAEHLKTLKEQVEHLRDDLRVQVADVAKKVEALNRKLT